MNLLSRVLAILLALAPVVAVAQDKPELKQQPASQPAASAAAATTEPARMKWWSEARFGIFIHWGLYAIPAGTWNGKGGHAEWIRESAQIPVEEYDKLVGQFNPTKFDANQWATIIQESGAKYVVITSKHHDGFALFDSKAGDFNVMSTPFKRDIIKELSTACAAKDVRFGFYHSIMDWHHPDYLPRRGWEAQQRGADGADFDRYVAYMKKQLRELLTNYGKIAVVWFDGQWEGTWTQERGADLLAFVRKLQPDAVVNDRVGKESNAAALKASTLGDYVTPEQEIPAAPSAGVPWETCMTMNDHWGWNKDDKHWKTGDDLLRKLCEVAGKGGNFLLNIGPTATGEFPPEAVVRLQLMGRWLRTYGESIHGTEAGPFPVTPWGACTQRSLSGGKTRLYLHLFDWPQENRLVLPGLANTVSRAVLLTPEGERTLEWKRTTDAIVIAVALPEPDNSVNVVAIDIAGAPDVGLPPMIEADSGSFLDTLEVRLFAAQPNVEIRYSPNGLPLRRDSEVYTKPFTLRDTVEVQARAFKDGRPYSPIASRRFEKVKPRRADKVEDPKPGIAWQMFEGDWSRMPDFEKLKAVKEGTAETVGVAARSADSERFALRFRGLLKVPKAGIYKLYLSSDDGSVLYLGGARVVYNDGLHETVEASGEVALDEGFHAIDLRYFQRTGQQSLTLSISGPDIKKQPVAADRLFHVESK